MDSFFERFVEQYGVHQQSGEYELGETSCATSASSFDLTPTRPQVVARVSRATASPGISASGGRVIRRQ